MLNEENCLDPLLLNDNHQIEDRAKCCVSEKTRINRYPQNIEFLRHYDDGDIISPSIRSLLSLVIYLNDDFEGGETVFHNQPDLLTKVKPENGMITLFLQLGKSNPLHSSAPHHAEGKYKYILRTNVLYSKLLSQPPS